MDDYLLPDWNAPSSVKAFVTTRKASPVGPSMAQCHEPGYDGLRRQWLSEWGADLANQWDWPVQPCWAVQVHGTAVIPADSPYGCEADAVWASQPNLPCGVMTADCLPVLFCNRAGTRVAAAHAGWRGLAGGVLENTFKTMNEPGEEMLAWLGPAISQLCFEVGPEVRQVFVDHHSMAEEAFIAGEGDRWFADLYMLARQRLQALGIMAITGGDHCTVTESDQFHSYRRDGSASGRLFSAIWICNK